MSRRAKKVQSLIRDELSTLLLTEISDPRLKHISISEVKLTEDLRQATVYYTVRGEGRPSPKHLKEMGQGFGCAASFLKRELGIRLKLRVVPDFKFFYDDHASSVARVMSLLDSVKAVSP